MFIDRIKIQRKAQFFFEKNVNEKRKAISPLIATILLVVVAVAIIGIVLSWGKGFANTTLSSADNINQKDSFTGLVWSFQTTGNNVLIENKSKQDLNITGYTINSLDHNGFWINSYHPLETTLSISPGTSNNVPLICMPEGKFILTLKTSTNENIPLNISPSKTLLGGTCEEYNVSLWEFANGTGVYTTGQISLAQGELVTNGGFDTDSDWTKGTGWTISGGTANANLSGNANLSQDIGLDYTKKYRVKYTILNYVSGQVRANLGNTTPGTWVSGNGTYQFDINPKSGSSSLIYMNSVDLIGSIDNISVTEIPPLPTITTGTKYLENTSAGTTAIESKQAYGEWEFDLYKGNDLSTSPIHFIANDLQTRYDFNGYLLSFINDERIGLIKSGPFNSLFQTNISYINNNTWYRIKIVRLNEDNIFENINHLISENASWTQQTWNSISVGRIVVANNQNANTYTNVTNVVNNGQKYRIKVKVSNYSSGTIIFGSNSELYNDISISGNGIYKFDFIHSGTTDSLYIRNSDEIGNYTLEIIDLKRIYPADTFAVFIKGGSFGDEWTLVDTTGGIGTNPVTDSTYTTSEYFVADLDAGDRIANVKIKPNIE